MASVLTAVVAALGFVFAGYKYFASRERLVSIRNSFSEAVDLLSADDPIHRRTGAIMLRRFFDSSTEQGGRDTPYAAEAVDVIAASLRGAETDSFQKLLADGLAHAPTLHGADLQRTNLQNAYLGVRKGVRDGAPVDLRGADFYRADLSGTSLKGALATGAQFYQARLANTVFDGAQLAEANFFESDLRGARFRGAELEGANFSQARNIPTALREHLDADGNYRNNPRGESPPPAERVHVFLSRPGAAEMHTRNHLRALTDRIQREGDFDVIELERAAYAETGAVAEVRRVMAGCAGVAVAVVPDLEVHSGTWRTATPDSGTITDRAMSSPWTTLELGVATGLGLPVLLIVDDRVDLEAFDFRAAEPGYHEVGTSQDHRSEAFRHQFDDWCGAVRERARQAT